MFFSLCGFKDAVTIKNIDDAVIDHVETFIKNDLIERLEKFSVNITDESQITMFFSYLFKDNPKSFQFSLGEKIQIREIAEYAARKFNINGARYFCDKKKIKAGILETVTLAHLGQLFTTTGIISKESNTDDGGEDLHLSFEAEKLEKGLYSATINCFNSSNIESKLITIFSPSNVSVKVEKGNIDAKIDCVFCDEPKKHSIGKKIIKNKVYWNHTNYAKHLKNVHKEIKQEKCTSKNVPKIVS